jgi:hypothetical protein
MRALTGVQGRVTPHSHNTAHRLCWSQDRIKRNDLGNHRGLARVCASRQWFQDKLKENYMLYTLAVVLIVLWLLGMVTGYTLGYAIHILLVIAVIMILVSLISGRRAV